MKFLLPVTMFVAGVLGLAVAMADGLQPAVTIHWAAITTMNDGTPIPSGTAVSYNLYGSHAPTGPWTGPTNILGTSTIRYGVAVGDDCYYLTSLVNGKESLPTTPFCLNVTNTPSTVPSTPTNVVITQNK